MDEPMDGVDSVTERVIFETLRSLRDRGKGVVVVHHDLRSASRYFDAVVMLNMRLTAAGFSSFAIDLAVSAAAARRSLVADGSVVRSSAGLRLTASGRVRAEALVRAHLLWESYLKQETSLPDDHLHEPAEFMEHFINESLERRIATEVKAPSADPHGRPIPKTKSQSDKVSESICDRSLKVERNDRNEFRRATSRPALSSGHNRFADAPFAAAAIDFSVERVAFDRGSPRFDD
jgi:Mn-dependent DtxR family transcriptional regulator